MKTLIKLFLAVIMMAGLATNTMAQVTLTGNTAGAELVVALTITNTTPLNFGVIAIPATAGAVTLSTAGLRTPSGTGVSIVASGTLKTVAKFDLTGTAADTYSFTLPSSITVATAGGGANKEMTIDNFVVKVDGASEVVYGSIGTCTLTSGASTVLVGGKLNINAAQTLGVYAGTYTVIVDYL
ncbi:MAG: DUF4402 domain-containing protein [Bacteroidia bacterium]|nr:DUF4402 domain-containing protein [Bacteroidia bacterium]